VAAERGSQIKLPAAVCLGRGLFSAYDGSECRLSGELPTWPSAAADSACSERPKSDIASSRE